MSRRQVFRTQAQPTEIRSRHIGEVQVPTQIRERQVQTTVREGPSSGARMVKGMEELAKIVADQSKDIKYLRSAVTKRGADRYVRARGGEAKGWSAHEADIVGDSDKEVFITNPRGEVAVLNGWKIVRNQQAIKKSLAEYNDDLRDQYGKDIPKETRVRLSMIKKEADKFDYDPNTKQYYWFENPDVPVRFQEVINTRRKHIPGPRKIFRKIIWNGLWPSIKARHTPTFNSLSGFDKGRVALLAFNQSYYKIIVEPAANEMGMGEDVNILMTIADIKKLLPSSEARKRFDGIMQRMVNELVDKPSDYHDHLVGIIDNVLSVILYGSGSGLQTREYYRPGQLDPSFTPEQIQQAEERARQEGGYEHLLQISPEEQEAESI